MNDKPNWPELCQLTSVPNWDLENGLPISRDLWWTAKLFYGQVVTDWFLPFISPCGSGTIFFSWYYGFRKLYIEITDGLWDCSEHEYGSWKHSIEGLLPEEAVKRVEAFYGKCNTDKWRQFR